MADKEVDLVATRKSLWALLRPESNFLWVVIIYGVAISLLTLATPIAVQTLINTIANIGSTRAVYVLAVTLFVILLTYGALSALRVWIVELYERHVYARLSAEMSYHVIRAPHSFFAGRRNAGITHRYFDIMVLKKNVPRLFVEGFALVLQMLVGFTLVAFYHPWLFIFNTLTIALVYLIWRFWANDAKRTAINLSRSKYKMAKWLSDMEMAHEFFKGRKHLDLAGQKTEAATAQFITRHREHFGYTFKQTLGFLLLYALGSSALLGLGGWLVNEGSLSIGQLVAAELIMSTIFLGLSRFASYLKDYYELYGTADKITEVLTIPQEPDIVRDGELPTGGDLKFRGVKVKHADRQCDLDLDIPWGSKVFIKSAQAWIPRAVLNGLRHHQPLESGWITLGSQALIDIDISELRQSIYSVDRSLIVECTIKEFLELASPDTGTDEMISVLWSVRLWPLIERLPDGLDTSLSVVGAPLQSVELLLLKLAAAILAKPRVVVLNQHFDQVLVDARLELLQVLQAQPFTVLYFTNNPDRRVFDSCINLTEGGSQIDWEQEAPGNE